ncbi:hypothetical protein LMH87_001139 [Akanthomyces muscarius]|uniref:Uncharacterized protein n=1 Tax=Akanthomyces muscarius TaxID=2231603 RepID=A0A9W8UPG7_AKAMU|nr:hypothetical protein LMH87_001139 [Akanthomyces muscarius]KAJ4155916.1 hypothetical protein LMH87_001139 [Akanthomyces muscarius]
MARLTAGAKRENSTPSHWLRLACPLPRAEAKWQRDPPKGDTSQPSLGPNKLDFEEPRRRKLRQPDASAAFARSSECGISKRALITFASHIYVRLIAQFLRWMSQSLMGPSRLQMHPSLAPLLTYTDRRVPSSVLYSPPDLRDKKATSGSVWSR